MVTKSARLLWWNHPRETLRALAGTLAVFVLLATPWIGSLALAVGLLRIVDGFHTAPQTWEQSVLYFGLHALAAALILVPVSAGLLTFVTAVARIRDRSRRPVTTAIRNTLQSWRGLFLAAGLGVVVYMSVVGVEWHARTHSRNFNWIFFAVPAGALFFGLVARFGLLFSALAHFPGANWRDVTARLDTHLPRRNFWVVALVYLAAVALLAPTVAAWIGAGDFEWWLSAKASAITALVGLAWLLEAACVWGDQWFPRRALGAATSGDPESGHSVGVLDAGVDVFAIVARSHAAEPQPTASAPHAAGSPTPTDGDRAKDAAARHHTSTRPWPLGSACAFVLPPLLLSALVAYGHYYTHVEFDAYDPAYLAAAYDEYFPEVKQPAIPVLLDGPSEVELAAAMQELDEHSILPTAELRAIAIKRIQLKHPELIAWLRRPIAAGQPMERIDRYLRLQEPLAPLRPEDPNWGLMAMLVAVRRLPTSEWPIWQRTQERALIIESARTWPRTPATAARLEAFEALLLELAHDLNHPERASIRWRLVRIAQTQGRLHSQLAASLPEFIRQAELLGPLESGAWPHVYWRAIAAAGLWNSNPFVARRYAAYSEAVSQDSAFPPELELRWLRTQLRMHAAVFRLQAEIIRLPPSASQAAVWMYERVFGLRLTPMGASYAQVFQAYAKLKSDPRFRDDWSPTLAPFTVARISDEWRRSGSRLVLLSAFSSPPSFFISQQRVQIPAEPD